MCVRQFKITFGRDEIRLLGAADSFDSDLFLSPRHGLHFIQLFYTLH